jgi:hypothetical protein
MTVNSSETFGKARSVWFLKPLTVSHVEAKKIANELVSNLQITHLALVCIDPKSRGISLANGKLILEALKNHRRLEFLSLEGNKEFGDGIASSILELLMYNPSLKMLNINDCGLTDYGAFLIAQGLQYNKSLIELRILEKNNITPIMTSGDLLGVTETEINGELELQAVALQKKPVLIIK